MLVDCHFSRESDSAVRIISARLTNKHEELISGGYANERSLRLLVNERPQEFLYLSLKYDKLSVKSSDTFEVQSILNEVFIDIDESLKAEASDQRHYCCSI